MSEKTMIFNGGDPLPGCPESWEAAYDWADSANESKKGEVAEPGEPMWSWDCGFKLDFDGPLVDITSRFYPPKTHYGAKWDGTVTVRLLGKDVSKKKFEEDTLDELRSVVESYVQSQADRIRELVFPETNKAPA